MYHDTQLLFPAIKSKITLPQITPLQTSSQMVE